VWQTYVSGIWNLASMQGQSVWSNRIALKPIFINILRNCWSIKLAFSTMGSWAPLHQLFCSLFLRRINANIWKLYLEFEISLIGSFCYTSSRFSHKSVTNCHQIFTTSSDLLCQRFLWLGMVGGRGGRMHHIFCFSWDYWKDMAQVIERTCAANYEYLGGETWR
jgi:hypothetical protein